jgi:hypothetical protein
MAQLLNYLNRYSLPEQKPVRADDRLTKKKK